MSGGNQPAQQPQAQTTDLFSMGAATAPVATTQPTTQVDIFDLLSGPPKVPAQAQPQPTATAPPTEFFSGMNLNASQPSAPAQQPVNSGFSFMSAPSPAPAAPVMTSDPFAP